MKTLKINRDKLNEKITEAVNDMCGFDWNGWGIDVIIDPESGEIFNSAKNSGNQVYASSKCMLTVEAWQFDKEEYADKSDHSYANVNWYMERFESGEVGYLDDLRDLFVIEFE